MIAASVYGWLLAQALWPSSIAALVYWAIPTVLGWLLGKRVFGRAWRELVVLVRQHTAATERLADAHKAQAEHLAAIAAHLSSTTIKREDDA